MSNKDILGFMVKPPRDIPVIYWPPFDGWMAIEAKNLRNPKAPQIVWMKSETWRELANCATRDGIFYIPCTESFFLNIHLRAKVMEIERTAVVPD